MDPYKKHLLDHGIRNFVRVRGHEIYGQDLGIIDIHKDTGDVFFASRNTYLKNPVGLQELMDSSSSDFEGGRTYGVFFHGNHFTDADRFLNMDLSRYLDEVTSLDVKVSCSDDDNPSFSIDGKHFALDINRHDFIEHALGNVSYEMEAISVFDKTKGIAFIVNGERVAAVYLEK